MYIKREGVFVRVPAGKQMYLYITETLELSQARIGNLRVAKHPPPVTFSSSNPINKQDAIQ